MLFILIKEISSNMVKGYNMDLKSDITAYKVSHSMHNFLLFKFTTDSFHFLTELLNVTKNHVFNPFFNFF